MHRLRTRLVGWPALIGLLLSAPPATGICADPPDQVDLLAALRVEAPMTLCDETVPIDERDVLERYEKEMLVALGDRPQIILWLKRTTRFFPFIEQVLAANRLPLDLKYLAIAESALRVHAGSRRGALGVWQLMPQTARRYGLIVNDRIDERRNFYLSTPAAIAYLTDLHAQFGSWSLALAAYNMGEEGLEAEILEQGHANYYRLYLSLETQRFNFRIMVIKQILESPGRYGLSLSADDFYPGQRFTALRIDAFADMPLRLIADASGTDFKTIKDLNPELRGHYLGAGSRLVNLPENVDAGFHERLAALVEADSRQRSQRIYVVQAGDSLSGIADKFEVPLAALLIWNRIGLNNVIHPGQRLVVMAGSAVDRPVDHTEMQEDGGG